MGDLFGPAASTDNSLARFDGLTGKLLKDGVVICDNAGNLSGIASAAFGATPATTGAIRLTDGDQIVVYDAVATADCSVVDYSSGASRVLFGNPTIPEAQLYAQTIVSANAGTEISLSAPSVAVPAGTLTVSAAAIGVAQTMGVLVQNTTAADVANEQWSPYQGVAGQAWNTNAGGATEEQRWFWQEQSTQGNPSTSALTWYNQRAGGAPAPRVKFGSDGTIHVANISTFQQCITADSASNRVYWGAATVGTATMHHIANSQFFFQVSSKIKVAIAAGGIQIGDSTTADFGSGVGVIGLDEAATVPTTNPTAGVVMYVEGGVVKFRDSAGAVHAMW